VPAGADAGGVAQHGAVFKLDRGRAGHAFTVSSVAWYAIDTGLFVSGSFDKTVKVPPRRQPERQELLSAQSGLFVCGSFDKIVKVLRRRRQLKRQSS